MFGRKSNTEQKVDLLIDGLRVVEKKVDNLTLLLHARGNPVSSASAEPKTEIEILSDELDEEIAKQPPTPVPEMEPEPKVEEPKPKLDISEMDTQSRIVFKVIKENKTKKLEELEKVWPLNEYSSRSLRDSIARLRNKGFLDEVNSK